MPGQLGRTSVVEAGSLLREFINFGANRPKVRHAQDSNHNPQAASVEEQALQPFFPLFTLS